MRLEDQVCNFELAKQLKDLGVKQDGLFSWAHDPLWAKEPFIFLNGSDCDRDYDFIYSAFTVAELGDMLPHQIPGGVYLSRKRKDIKSDEKVGGWEVLYQDNSGISCMELGVNEADARAKMLIYLIEKGLVKP